MSTKKTQASLPTTLMSMTGFGRCEREEDGVVYTVELRSVNSRFLDCVCKVPRSLSMHEKSLRDYVAGRFHRGRIEVAVDVQQSKARQSQAMSVNSEFVSSQMNVYLELADRFTISRDSFAGTALQLVLQQRAAFDGGEPTTSQEPDLNKQGTVLLESLEKAANDLFLMMSEEGSQLARAMTELFSGLVAFRERTEGLLHGYIERQFEVYKERVGEIVRAEPAIDQSRLALELAVMADKMDVSEELTRLKSHEQQLREALLSTPCGRKIEFILQEFGREWNTLGVKSQHAEVHAIVVEAKVCLEKMREQAANLV
jgi:uncharacterized protein (TIGR00255 family)